MFRALTRLAFIFCFTIGRLCRDSIEIRAISRGDASTGSPIQPSTWRLVRNFCFAQVESSSKLSLQPKPEDIKCEIDEENDSNEESGSKASGQDDDDLMKELGMDTYDEEEEGELKILLNSFSSQDHVLGIGISMVLGGQKLTVFQSNSEVLFCLSRALSRLKSKHQQCAIGSLYYSTRRARRIRCASFK